MLKKIKTYLHVWHSFQSPHDPTGDINVNVNHKLLWNIGALWYREVSYEEFDAQVTVYQFIGGYTILVLCDIVINYYNFFKLIASVSLCFFQVMEMDISKQLHAYEVEYHVLQDEMLDAGPSLDDSDRLDKLEKTNGQLKKQNMDLLEKLQVRMRRIDHNLQAQ